MEKRCLFALAVLGLIAPLYAGTTVVPPAGPPEPVAGFRVVSETAFIDRDLLSAYFEIVFSDVPDFETTDELGRPANEFQYYIGQGTLDLANPDVVIRQELGLTDRLFVRNGETTSDDESSGGWGEVIAVIPLDPQAQEDAVVRFNLPLEDIQQEGVSEFNYHLEAYEFGGTTSVHTGTATAIPLPAALPAGLLLLGGVAFARKLGRA